MRSFDAYLDACGEKLDALAQRLDVLIDDLDPTSREQKLRSLAARPGTKGEGSAAKAALSRMHKSGGTVVAKQNAIAKSFGYSKTSGRGSSASSHYHGPTGSTLSTGFGP